MKSASIVGKRAITPRTITLSYQIKESQKKYKRKVNEFVEKEIKSKLLDQPPTLMTPMPSHIQLVRLS